MITINYDPAFTGTLYPDGLIEGAVEAFLHYPNLTFTTGQEMLITAFRVAIKEGRLDCEKFQVVCGDDTYRFDSDGRTEDGRFTRINMEFLLRLL